MFDRTKLQLDSLIAMGIIFSQWLSAQKTYFFKSHALKNVIYFDNKISDVFNFIIKFNSFF
jgi:hypothetical protein